MHTGVQQCTPAPVDSTPVHAAMHAPHARIATSLLDCRTTGHRLHAGWLWLGRGVGSDGDVLTRHEEGMHGGVAVRRPSLLLASASASEGWSAATPSTRLV